MYEITVRANSGYNKVFKVLEEQYALFYFKSFIQGIDVHSVLMTDGLTGEVIYEWYEGVFTIMNGVTVL